MTHTTRRFMPMAFVGTLVFFATAAALAAPRVSGGQWEHVTVRKADSSKFAACMSDAEAASLNSDSQTARAYFEKQAPSMQKAIRSFDLQGNTLSYVIVVGDRTIESKTTFHGDTSETFKTTKGPAGTDTVTIKSRRVGPCA
ncbi:MAG: hypothetical protein ABI330_04110 [Caldimonas sp.]|nr:hypothetical protein [Pseudomonadota bacterium]